MSRKDPYRKHRPAKFYRKKEYIDKIKHKNSQRYIGKKWHRNRLFQKDNICGICHNPILNAKDATIDHIIPTSKGGLDVIENMQLAHWDCNQQKGNNYEED